jgi:hypothetical protein
MAGPLGVLSVSLVAATTEVGDIDGGPLGVLAACPAAVTTVEVEDVDGGPPRGCCRYFCQRPPLKLGTSTAGPLTSMAICSKFCKKDVGSNK